MKIAITGASGKTGYRIAEEAVKKRLKIKQIVRKDSKVIEGLKNIETIIIICMINLFYGVIIKYLMQFLPIKLIQIKD